jgi:hypothetical protein
MQVPDQYFCGAQSDVLGTGKLCHLLAIRAPPGLAASNCVSTETVLCLLGTSLKCVPQGSRCPRSLDGLESVCRGTVGVGECRSWSSGVMGGGVPEIYRGGDRGNPMTWEFLTSPPHPPRHSALSLLSQRNSLHSTARPQVMIQATKENLKRRISWKIRRNVLSDVRILYGHIRLWELCCRAPALNSRWTWYKATDLLIADL